MRDEPSSRPSGGLSGLHLLATSFAAVAGVGLAAWQIFSPQPAKETPPVQVTVAVEPARPASPVVEPAKADASMSAADLAAEAHLSAALNDGADQRYALASLFDGKAETSLTLAGDDRELNVLVSFAGGQSAAIRGLEYVPPPGTGTRATAVDMAILPAGKLEATGLPIHSFTLPAGEAQTFTLPAAETGKAVWLRISSDAPAASLAIGDFKLVAAN